MHENPDIQEIFKAFWLPRPPEYQNVTIQKPHLWLRNTQLPPQIFKRLIAECLEKYCIENELFILNYYKLFVHILGRNEIGRYEIFFCYATMWSTSRPPVTFHYVSQTHPSPRALRNVSTAPWLIPCVKVLRHPQHIERCFN